MRTILTAIRRSKTLLFSVALAVLGVLEQSKGVLEPILKEYAGLAFIAIAVLIAVLRILTTQSLADKSNG